MNKLGFFGQRRNPLFPDYTQIDPQQAPQAGGGGAAFPPLNVQQDAPDLNQNMPQVIAPEAAKKPGAFSQGGKAWQILGILGDGMQTWGGGHATYTPAMLDLQQQTAREKAQLDAYSRKREDDWTDFQRQRDYEVAHPKPVNNDTSNDYAFIAEKLGPDAANQYLRNQGDPMVTIPLPNGQVYSGPRSGLAASLGAGASAGRSGPQPGMIEDGHRFKGGDPANPANWEAVGGAAPSASGPFVTP